VDDAKHKAEFANYGTGWVDLAAPGVGITSAVPVSGSILYGTWSGTSMATPFAAGAAALVREYLPDAQPSEIADLLVRSGSDLDADNPEYAGKLGRLLNIGAALLTTQPQTRPSELFLPVLLAG
jgi:subtilisin family serine protease